MNNNGTTSYKNDFPKEIKLVIKGLDDDIRLSIVELLFKKNKLAFNELKKELNVNSSSLSYHLTLLQDGGLVNNFLEFKDISHSYYKLTGMAYEILDFLFQSIVSIPVSEPAIPRVASSRVTLDKPGGYLFVNIGTNNLAINSKELKELVLMNSAT